MKIRSLSVTAALLTIFCNVVLAEPCSECSKVLQYAPFNTKNVSSSKQAQDYFHKLLCTAQWSSYQEAQKAGIDVSIPIFDIPIPLNVNWDNNKKSAWQTSHCSNVERQSDYQSSLVIALREVDPNVVPAWSQCVQAVCAPQALSCSITTNGGIATLSARWIQGIGEPESSAPKVQQFNSFGMKCESPLAPKSIIQAGGNVVACKIVDPESSSNLFVLQTNRGTCIQSVSADNFDRVISGKQRLSQATAINANRILFKGDAQIVTDGYDLSISAKIIQFEGVPLIVSFLNDRADRASGDNGRPAGRIEIKAQELRGSMIQINNFGENGTKGATGGKGATGPQGAPGSGMGWCGVNGCCGGHGGGSGGQGGKGNTGLVGGEGGNGGDVRYQIGTGLGTGLIKRIDVIQTTLDSNNHKIVCAGTCGGLGGLGGDGGAGGDGGPGGPGGAGGLCGGTPAGPPGPPGQVGEQGPQGRMGNPGKVIAQ